MLDINQIATLPSPAHLPPNMNVSIALDDPKQVRTNLDLVKGKVVLRLSNAATITSIVVKLEGDSITRLMTPVTDERSRPQQEIHKVG